MSPTLLSKLAAAAAATPNLSFGRLIESVENVVWDMIPQRSVSERLMHIPDEVFEHALDLWARIPAARKVVGE